MRRFTALVALALVVSGAPLLAAYGCSGSSVAPDLVAPADAATPSQDDGSVVPGEDGSAGPDSATADASATHDSGTSRPLGTVAEIAPGSACPRGTLCRGIRVTCPGAEDIDGVVAVADPAGVALKGTIVTHIGGGGTGFLFQQPVIARYQAAGFRIAAISWAKPWEEITSGTRSIKAAACRPATAFRWVFDVVHAKSRTLGFCAQGQSGGAGAVSYALATYGLEGILDHAVLTQGPPFGRMDCGCGSTKDGCASVPALCPEIASPVLPLPGPTIDTWAGTTTCGTPGVTDADLTRLRDDSSAWNDGDFDYPKTHLSGWFCAQRPNGTTGGGAFFLGRVTPKPKVFCSPSCAVESIYDAANTLTGGKNVVDAMTDEMIAECVPRH